MDSQLFFHAPTFPGSAKFRAVRVLYTRRLPHSFAQKTCQFGRVLNLRQLLSVLSQSPRQRDRVSIVIIGNWNSSEYKQRDDWRGFRRGMCRPETRQVQRVFGDPRGWLIVIYPLEEAGVQSLSCAKQVIHTNTPRRHASSDSFTSAKGAI